jgi:hypothetical protein
LAVLISRVREDEKLSNSARKEHLINLAEFILSWSSKYTRAEYDQAVALLAKYHLAHLASKRHGLKWIQTELDKKYKARCGRCGLPISSKVSLAVGYGHVCRRKLGIAFSKNADRSAIKRLPSMIAAKSKEA